jgi:hypothetical protein
MTRGTPQHHWTPAFQDSNEWDAGRMLAFDLVMFMLVSPGHLS